MKYKVMKPIPADDGSVIPTGEVVKAEGWRNVRQLVNGRYLAPLFEVPADAIVVETPAVESPAGEQVESEQPKPKAKKPTAK